MDNLNHIGGFCWSRPLPEATKFDLKFEKPIWESIANLTKLSRGALFSPKIIRERAKSIQSKAVCTAHSPSYTILIFHRILEKEFPDILK